VVEIEVVIETLEVETEIEEIQEVETEIVIQEAEIEIELQEVIEHHLIDQEEIENHLETEHQEVIDLLVIENLLKEEEDLLVIENHQEIEHQEVIDLLVTEVEKEINSLSLSTYLIP
jgi:hypothetical protein